MRKTAITTMRRYRLPPLDLLESFESAARHLSFTRAADELALTQSAVSRQIALLEERLGVALFQRLHRALRLTEAGERLQATTATVLQQLHNVREALAEETRARTVTITTTPGFAGLWLIPRLAGYTALHPEVDVRISATHTLVNLERDGVDLAIRYGPPPPVASGAQRLFGEAVTPVCSPVLAADPARPLRRPADLARHTLLHVDPNMAGAQLLDWQLWLRAMLLDDLKPAGRLHFSLYDQMIHAAMAGQGVALGRLPLVAGLLREGRLVAPFERSVASPLGYHLMRSAGAARNPEVQPFADWLLAEARREAAAPLPTRPKGRGRDSSGPAGRARA
jgi:LysR family glycine cleavage system transcriptional activator